MKYDCSNTRCTNKVDHPGELCKACKKDQRRDDKARLEELEKKPRGGREWVRELAK